MGEWVGLKRCTNLYQTICLQKQVVDKAMLFFFFFFFFYDELLSWDGWLMKLKQVSLPARTIARRSHHHKPPKRHEQDLNLCRAYSSALDKCRSGIQFTKAPLMSLFLLQLTIISFTKWLQHEYFPRNF